MTGNADDGGPVTLYDYRNEFRGAAFVGNQPTNTKHRDQYYSIETGVSKRMSNRWQASVSYFATKRDILIDKVIATPNQEDFNKDQTWSWGSIVTALVQLPMALQLSSFVQPSPVLEENVPTCLGTSQRKHHEVHLLLGGLRRDTTALGAWT